jgi:Ankyrin repeats (3 copies)
MCQLRILPNCLPATVQNVLERFDPSLDKTYGRVMTRVPNENWEHAHRMFQFLAASVRPLLVDELSEILSIDYDTGTTPKYEAIWHPETPAADIFTVCHNLVTVDDINGIPTVQFAHISVPNWLFSERILGEPVTDRVRRYRCNIQDSHWVATQTCISSLLHFDEKLPTPLNRETVKIFTMADYAAQHWVHHARYGNVAEREDIRLGIERLFDQERTFNAWIWLHDVDNPERESMPTECPTKPAPSPLYYAALCGFPLLVKHLADKDPEGINATGGRFCTPLHAASTKGNLAAVQVLIELGAETTATDNQNRTPSQVALANGQYAVAQLLEQYDVN